MEKFYVTPEVEYIEINVEKGYAATDILPGGSTEGDNEIDE